MKRRVTQASLAFVLTLATTAILWTRGREFGQAEVLRPAPSPLPAVSAFTDPQLKGLAESDYAQRLTALQAKLPGATQAKQKSALGNAFVELALAAHFRNQGEGLLSLQAYEAGLMLFRAAGDPRGEAGARMNQATTLAMLGRVAEAEAGLKAAQTYYDSQDGLRLQSAEVACRLGELFTKQGRYAEAQAVLDRALRVRQELEEVTGQADCLSALGQVAFEQDQQGLSRVLLQQAAQLYASQGKVESRAAVLGQLGDVALASGEVAEAETLFAEGLAVWKKADQGFWVGRFLARQAQVALAKSDLATAERLAKESLGLLEASNGPLSAAWPLFVLGEVAQEKKDIVASKHFFEQALALREKAGAHWATVQTKAALAR